MVSWWGLVPGPAAWVRERIAGTREAAAAASLSPIAKLKALLRKAADRTVDQLWA